MLVTTDAEDLASKYAEEAEKELRKAEKWWRGHYDMLERHGYRLRSRYKPGWIPPWKVTGKNRFSYEEHLFSFVSMPLKPFVLISPYGLDG